MSNGTIMLTEESLSPASHGYSMEFQGLVDLTLNATMSTYDLLIFAQRDEDAQRTQGQLSPITATLPAAPCRIDSNENTTAVSLSTEVREGRSERSGGRDVVELWSTVQQQ